jgi:hypothetical protein
MRIALRDNFNLVIVKSKPITAYRPNGRLQWTCSVENGTARGEIVLKDEGNRSVYLDSLYAKDLEGLPGSRGIMRTALCRVLETLRDSFDYVTLLASGNTPKGNLRDLVEYYKRSFGFIVDPREGTPEQQYDNGLIFMIAKINTILKNCERY